MLEFQGLRIQFNLATAEDLLLTAVGPAMARESRAVANEMRPLGFSEACRSIHGQALTTRQWGRKRS